MAVAAKDATCEPKSPRPDTERRVRNLENLTKIHVFVSFVVLSYFFIIWIYWPTTHFFATGAMDERVTNWMHGVERTLASEAERNGHVMQATKDLTKFAANQQEQMAKVPEMIFETVQRKIDEALLGKIPVIVQEIVQKRVDEAVASLRVQWEKDVKTAVDRIVQAATRIQDSAKPRAARVHKEEL